MVLVAARPPAAAASARLLDRRALAGGVRAMAPWLVGFGIYGLVVGVSTGRAGLAGPAGWLTAPLVYSGGAQVAAIDLFDAGAAPVVIVATVLAVNSRLIVYSAALGERWRSTPGWWRALAALVLVDPSFAVGNDRYGAADDDLDPAHAHYLGAAVVLWLTWLVAVAVGILTADRIPDGLRLEFVIPLFLAAEVARLQRTPAVRRAWAIAAAVAVVGATFPFHLGLLAAIAAGTAAALAREDRS